MVSRQKAIAKTCSLQKVPLLWAHVAIIPSLSSRNAPGSVIGFRAGQCVPTCLKRPCSPSPVAGKRPQTLWCRAMRPGACIPAAFSYGRPSLLVGGLSPIQRLCQKAPKALLRDATALRYLPKYASPLVPLVPRLVDRLIFPSGERRLLHTSLYYTTAPAGREPPYEAASKPNKVKQSGKKTKNVRK